MTEPTNPTRLGRRVVVTGIGGITALGHDWPSIANRLKAQKTV